MRPFSMVFVLLALLTSCTPAADSDGNAKSVSPSGQARVSALRNASGVHADPGAGIASLPDRGSLMAYDRVRRIASNRAYTWYPVTLSEAHALNAIRTGRLALTAPDGSVVSLSYDRHDEHPDGSWSWIGHDRDSGDALLTFGPEAVFGSVTRADGSLLRITTRSNQVYVVSIDPEQLANSENSGRFRKADFLVPPRTAAAITDRRAIAAAQPGAADAGVDAVAAAANEIDLLLGYSNGLVASIGSESGAVTRMQNLVAIANQAYQNSSITMRIRLVRSMLVNYPDNTANESALEKLTGRTGSGSTPVDPAFNALRAAREESGADLVSLVRQFRTPENDGCGIAWLLGGGQTAIDQSDEAFGYSVVSDGSDAEGASTYFCRDETLAHELGHNMGQAHNIEDSDGSSGAHAYSYGYREASASGFYTVMAYRLSDSNQTGIRHFANPAVTWNGRPTGTASQADNARSMNQTMPAIAAFRTSRVPDPDPPPPVAAVVAATDINADGKSDLIWYHPARELLAYWVVDGNSVVGNGEQAARHGDRVLTAGDYNGDGRVDLLWRGTGGDIQFWQGNGVGFDPKPFYPYPQGWNLVASEDVNADGKTDLVWYQPARQLIAYWILNGNAVARNGEQASGRDYRVLTAGDFNGDRRVDLLWLGTYGDLQMWQGNGTGFDWKPFYQFPGGWNFVASDDLNADGKSDLIWYHPGRQLIAYWVVDGNTVVRNGEQASGRDYRVVTTGDFNGDRRVDLLWLGTYGDLQMWQGNGTGFDWRPFYQHPNGWNLLNGTH